MRAVDPGIFLDEMRQRQPLVHNITNYVVMNFTANILLAAGAAPVMAHAVEEAAEMAGLASALVLNIGTLSPPWIEAMKMAGRRAAGRIPIVLDPVGAGATAFRTETARQLLDELPVTVLRGNASEIMACTGMTAGTRGVDSSAAVSDARLAAEELAVQHRLVVAVTGATDIVTDGRTTIQVSNGHSMMGRVTGTGCAATALVAAFCAASSSTLAATAAALAYFGVAGERAAAVSAGPGSFQVALLDQLHRLSAVDLDGQVRLGTVNAGDTENA